MDQPRIHRHSSIMPLQQYRPRNLRHPRCEKTPTSSLWLAVGVTVQTACSQQESGSLFELGVNRKIFKDQFQTLLMNWKMARLTKNNLASNYSALFHVTLDAWGKTPMGRSLKHASTCFVMPKGHFPFHQRSPAKTARMLG